LKILQCSGRRAGVLLARLHAPTIIYHAAG
jgi:hypothetical protein